MKYAILQVKEQQKTSAHLIVNSMAWKLQWLDLVILMDLVLLQQITVQMFSSLVEMY